MKRFWFRLLQLELIVFGAALIALVFLRVSIIERGLAMAPAARIIVPAAGVLSMVLALALSLPVFTVRVGAQRLEHRARSIQRAAAWCLLPLLLMDIFLRVYIYIPVVWIVNTSWFGPVPIENSFTLVGNEGFALSYYGKLGEVRTPFSGGENILFVGDSRTEAMQVMDEEKFASIAESLLRERGLDVDVRNMGESGRAMADYVTYIPLYKELFHPSLIVVQIGEKDFIESFSHGKENYFTLDSEQRIRVVHKYKPDGPLEIASQRTLNLYPMVARWGLRRLELMSPAMLAANEDTGEAGGDGGGDGGESAGSAAVPAEEMIREQMRLLREAAGDTPLMIVLSPSVPRIQKGSVVTTDAGYENFKQLIIQYSGSTVIDPLPRFAELAKQGYLPAGFFNSTRPDIGHLNRHGNRVLGELLADAIEEELR